VADIRTFDAADKLTQAAADLILETAKEAVRDRGRFTLGLSGGPTLAMLYRLLACEPYSARMPREQTFVFWCDERWVADTEPESNQRMAREELLDRLAIPRDQIRTILTAGLEPADSAEVAQRHISELFDGPARPDIVLLSMADDGHTVALFNASSVL
jgi:6-phosphogluconolactonase